MWADAVARGKTAHGSMPHLGENAIYTLARAVLGLDGVRLRRADEHPLLGAPTVSLGTFSGGININSVPDRADGGHRRADGAGAVVRRRAGARSGNGSVTRSSSRRAWRSTRSTPTLRREWVQEVFAVMGPLIDETPEPRGLAYFTDAAALSPAYGSPPTIICGPGDAEQAHRTDESCSVAASGGGRRRILRDRATVVRGVSQRRH